MSPSRPVGRPAPWQQTPEVPFQSLSREPYQLFQSPPPRVGGAEVLSQKVREETLGIPTYGSGLSGSSVAPIALKRGLVTSHLPLEGWLEMNL